MDARTNTEAALSRALGEVRPLPQSTEFTHVEKAESPQLIIDEYKRNTNALQSLSVKRIDTAIERLQNLKTMIELKCKKSLDEVTELVRLVDDGLRDVNDLESRADKIEGAVLDH